MRAICLGLLGGCAGTLDTDVVDTDIVDTDDTDLGADTDTDAPPAPPCDGYVAILDLPGSYEGAIDRTDPERWTGQGDKPTELLAVNVPDTAGFRFTVTYPRVSTGTSTKYWMQAVFLDSTCAIRVADASVTGDAENDRVSWIFTPDVPGWWFPMLHFGEALVVNESVPYTAEIAPL